MATAGPQIKALIGSKDCRKDGAFFLNVKA